MRSTVGIRAAILLGGTFLSSTAFAQCPAIGNDTGCGTVITVTGTGATVQTGLQGPYDGSDDTLVGVVNNIPACTGGNAQTACGISISSLDLTSNNNIFGFDGDGITTFGAAGNSRDGTGYGGPNAYFTNINSGATSGRVNFITPIPPGGTGFFALENALSSANSCTTALNNAVPKPAGGGTITTTFTPNGGLTLAQAAQICGFIGWDWQQTITTLPTPTPGDFFNAITPPTTRGTTAPVTPFNDPPASGYNYMLPVPPGPLDAPQLKVYYDPFNGPNSGGFALSANSTANTLSFFDSPADYCLPGAQDAVTKATADKTKANGGCGGPGIRAAAGSTINFTTHLVGFQGQFPGASVIDTGIGFSWTSNFNGTNGTIAVLPALSGHGPDPGTGTGGIAVTSYNGTPTYSGVGVSAINGASGGPSTLLSAMLPASRSVQIGTAATAFATIINTSPNTATSCSIAPLGGLPLTFAYQTTNPQTNAVTGTANTPVDIAGNNGSQSFVIALTPTAAISPTNVQFSFSCTNANPAPVVTGLTTLLFSGSSSTPPDVVTLAGTSTNDGILHITGTTGTAAFATATVNVGASASITASANTGSATLPLALKICQTNPSNGQCLAPPAASVNTTIGANATPTFSIFGTASGAIPFDPANNRIFVVFTDSSNAIRGETSVAVQTQ